MADALVGILGVGLVEATAPQVRADDLGLVRGDGCFETVRVRPDGGLDDLDLHLERLARSTAALELPPTDPGAWRELAGTMLAAWTGGTGGEAVLRLILTRGPSEAGPPTAYALLSAISERQLSERRDGVTAITLSRGLTADATVEAPWLLGGVKAISYAVNMAALRYARAAGADDVIFTSADGQLLEAPTATVVWLAGGVLRTPPPQPLGLLDGVTVRHLFADGAGFGTEIQRGTTEDLYGADGVWLLSSVRVAAAVNTLDGKPLATDPEITARVRRAAGA
ncbi:MAG TPA: aminotransferase class IV [Mycobacteriales bacterium]|nr:aminotransferase class IV [Mycobacteriales bacterium]